MARKNENARRLYAKSLSFTQMCRAAGISPLQRIKLIRTMQKMKKGGELNKE